MSELPQKAPLDGVRVIDLGGALAGPLAAMLLTDQGADAIRIVARTGRRPAAPINAVLDRGKKSLSLDLKSAEGRDKLEGLLQDADILIENYAPGVLVRLGLNPETLRERFPSLIIVSLPGFGAGDKTLSEIKAYEGVIAAATGQYTDIHAVRGLFGLDPVYTALPLASVYAAVHGATAAVLALRARDQGAPAPYIETPLASAAMSAMSSMYMRIENQPERYVTPRLPGMLKNVILPLLRRMAKSGGDARQQKFLAIARKSYPAFMTSYPCSDGELLYIFAIDNAKLARALLTELDLLDKAISEGLVFVDPYSGDRDDNLSETSNLSRKWQATLKEWVAARLATSTASEWEARLSAAGVPCTVQRTTQEWLGVPELQEAGIVVAVDDPNLGLMRQPGLLAWLSDAPKTIAHPQSRLSGDIVGQGAWTTEGHRSAPQKRDALSGGPHAPLEGVTVIDMCSMVAGPVAGRTLAEYGARVIKVETPSPNHGPRMTCWYGVDGNQGKESILLDLKTDAGRSAFDPLLKQADILLTNHMPAAMAGMGLSEEQVRAVNPAIIYCRLNAYNGPLGGPWASRSGYDPVLQAASGIMTRYGDPGHPELHAIASCVDALTGYSAAFGMALALYRQAQDGAGRCIDASLASAATLVQLPFAFDFEGRNLNEPSGQLVKGEHPFYRLYRAKDGWLFLAATEAEVSRLPSALRPEDKSLSGDALATWIESRMRSLRVRKATRLLNEAGLSAVAVSDIASLTPKLLKAAKTSSLRLVRRDVPGAGPVVSAPALQARWDGEPLGLLRPAEKPGASTDKILTELGLDAEKLIKSGAAAREISNEYLPA